MANLKTVFHCTKSGIGSRIEKDGWIVPKNINNGQVYGRGIYFWEFISDAHKFGKEWYGENSYEIIEETIPLNDGEYENYDHNKRIGDHDDISKALIRRGIRCLIISRAYMDNSTLQADGRAFVWLVDIDNNYTEIRY